MEQISKLFVGIFTNESSSAVKYRAFAKKIIENNFWFSFAYEVAELGIFNKPNKTPLESVHETNCMDVLHYLNVKQAQAKLINYD